MILKVDAELNKMNVTLNIIFLVGKNNRNIGERNTIPIQY